MNVRSILVPKLSKQDAILSVGIFLGIYTITCTYNYFAQFEDYKPFFLQMLKSAEPIIVSLVFTVWFFIKPESIRKIFAFLIVAVASMLINLDESYMRNLWNEMAYPSMSIMFRLYMYPIDPFQIIALFPIFLFKSHCERGIIALSKIVTRNRKV